MEYGVKNKNLLKMLVFFVALIIMVGGYNLIFCLYESVFTITSHRTVGLIFISFFFVVVASPVLLLTLFFSFRISFIFFVCGLIYSFVEWFSLHPLRVMLMGTCFFMGYLFSLKANAMIVSSYRKKNEHLEN